MVDNPDYSVGTVSITTGTKILTGVGTMWLSADLEKGDQFGFDGYAPARIDTINNDNSISLLDTWRGPTLTTSPYFIRYQADGSGLTGQSVALRRMLSQPVLTAFAGLTGSSGKLPIFTGANTMTLADYIADPNGSLAKLAGLSLGANKALVTNGSSNAEQINLSTAGRALLNLGGSNTDFVRGDGTLAAVLGAMGSGALMETGLNANGNYWRFRNGLQVTARSSGTVFINSANNALFVNGAAIGPYTLAAAFASEPYEVITGHNLSGVGHCWVSSVNRPNTTQSSQMQLWRSTADSTSQYFCRMIHVGSWN